MNSHTTDQAALEHTGNVKKRLTPEQLAAVFDQVSSALRGWGLTTTERAKALHSSTRTIGRWEASLEVPPHLFHGRLSEEQFYRWSLILGIHKGLRIVFATPGSGDQFMQSANHGPTFGGCEPRELLLRDQKDMYRLRRYLDAMHCDSVDM